MASISLQEEEMLSEKVKKYPVLYDKQCKGYKEKDAVENAWTAVAKELEFVENGEIITSVHTPQTKYTHIFHIMSS